MKIAIVSDIHAGMDSVAQDLCPRELLQTEQDNIAFSNKRENYVNDFLAFVKDTKLSADYILVPGDVTDKAHPMEAKLASECLQKIGTALSVPSDKILFVPGNHDSNWRFHDIADKTGIMWAHRYIALQSDQFIFSAINGNAEKGSLFEKDYFSIWRYNDVIVVGYNSASAERPSDEVKCGNIIDEHLRAMEKVFKNLGIKSDSRLKIFMLHHHLHDFKAPKGSKHDYSLAQNGESLITLLRKYKFDLIVHGHRHYSCFDAQNCVVPIFCSGSFSAQIGTEWAREVSNQFHIIEIREKRIRKNICGVIQSWSNTSEGWEPSPTLRNRPIVGYQRAFGFSLDDEYVAKKVRNVIATFAHKKIRFSWREEIVPKIPDLKYLCQSRDDILDWCQDGMLSSLEWDIFAKEDDDVFFCKK